MYGASTPQISREFSLEMPHAGIQQQLMLEWLRAASAQLLPCVV